MALMAVALFCGVSPGGAVAEDAVDAASGELPALARAVPQGGRLRTGGVDLGGGAETLTLERFDVFAADAVITVRGDGYEVQRRAPGNAYFRGSVEGDPTSVAVVTVPERGPLHGVVSGEGGIWLLERTARGAEVSLRARGVDVAEVLAEHPFECGTEGAVALSEGGGGAAGAAVEAAGLASYSARIAVETDYEFYARFGDATAAADYVGDLFAYGSTIYEAEVGTSLVVGSLDLWAGGPDSDPWTTSSCSSLLGEFRDYWNANRSSVQRTVAHFLSGKSTGCGVAYLGVLCNSSYGYGLSGSLAGNFSIDNPSVVWDILVVNHEIGHNFNSPHTHCYGGIGGVADPVDPCYASEGGCYAGAAGLPAGCGGSGQGCGTIMSYCHLRAGGYGNITMTFGVGHPYGIAPDRVPDRMSSYVEARAASSPGCLDSLAAGVVLSVQRSGSGGGTVTSDPAGINCGSDCTQEFAVDTSVQLNAAADAFSAFGGWSGDADCADGLVTMNADKLCTATFVSTCGDGVRNGAEECDGGDLGGATCGGCSGTPACDAQCRLDFGACSDGVCDTGESCEGCPADCVGPGATCGNGICEAGDGEDCVNCAVDCAGVQNGKPSGRYCCGFGGSNPIGCAAACGPTCTTDSAATCCGDGACGGDENSFTCGRDCGAPAVCGDGVCTGGESECSCAADCGAPPATEVACGDGQDDDCDGSIDCADADCGVAPQCSCGSAGQLCSSDADCCSGRCRGKQGSSTCR